MGFRQLNILILLAALLFVTSCKMLQQEPPPLPIISITFDDQHANVYSKALPLMSIYGYRGSCFVNSHRLGRVGMLSQRDVTSLFNEYNWEIGGHSLNHEHLAELSYQEAETAIGADYVNLSDLGVNPRSFAIPSGNCPQEYYPIITHFYKNVRGSSDFAMYDPVDRHSLGYFTFQSGWSASIVIERIRRGIANRESLIVLGFHRIDGGENEDYAQDNCPLSEFADILRYINNLKLEVLPLAEAVDKLSCY
ncbi:MAG: hypothetical protein CVU50_08090 [Candidatus Cloacimonetes bacterium HGW-Cloacimonetes-3]|jgi:peptidoglycan/xylan/chitin deacetylase (PgdA/CDA1 family)|nr:MAG: hypothetical protein CVU50_08090 [Candidatus Cloacimonetes bacterium HGW-Cloacimonetes-3]